MVVFVKLFGVLCVIMGVIFAIKPKAFDDYISFWKKIKNLRIGGVVSILFGFIFLTAAPQCDLAGLITVLGIWAIIKGVLLLTLKPEKLYAYIDWWVKKIGSYTRVLSAIIIAFGALILYAA